MNVEFLCELGIGDDIAQKIISAHTGEIDALRLDFAVEKELAKRGVKSMTAAKKLFDTSGLTLENDNMQELNERLDGFQAENDFLFEKEDNHQKPIFSDEYICR